MCRIGHPHLRTSCIEALHVPKEGCNVLLLLQQQHYYYHHPTLTLLLLLLLPPLLLLSVISDDEMLKIEKFRYCFMFGILLLCEIPI